MPYYRISWNVARNSAEEDGIYVADEVIPDGAFLIFVNLRRGRDAGGTPGRRFIYASHAVESVVEVDR